MTVQIIQEDERGNIVVGLSSLLDTSWYSPASFSHTVAVIDQRHVGLYRYPGEEQAECFTLSKEEVDHLVEAYQEAMCRQEVYRAQQAERVAELERASYSSVSGYGSEDGSDFPF